MFFFSTGPPKFLVGFLITISYLQPGAALEQCLLLEGKEIGNKQTMFPIHSITGNHGGFFGPANNNGSNNAIKGTTSS